ncbi:hypothetical protein CMK13_18835 [Candidatus Poribacteria bacterium]|nr:hypothetical protein [Candidatus Poribacteria bacterium]
MNSLYDFIVKPIGESRYNNSKKIGEKELILNTKIESWKFVNRFAKVVSTPLAINTIIKKGDIIVVHQNIFRRFYNMKGKQTNSRSYFKKDLYFAAPDQIYLYKNKGEWQSFGDRCFVKPIKNSDHLKNRKEEPYVGILKISNNNLEASNINPGDTIGFKPGSEWEFFIDDERLYCMKSNDIVINYGNKENKREYNPSWTYSS